MIWYKRSRLGKSFYDYILIPHPDIVFDFSWREADQRRNIKAALMTHCRDGITRFWSQSDLGHGFQSFSLAGAIDTTNQGLVNPSPTLENHALKHYPVQWLTGKALSSALVTQRELFDFKESLHEKLNTKLLDTIHEFPDMIFQISSNGTMSIWGIQGLGLDPHRVTKINLIFRTESCIPANQASFFQNYVTSVHLKSSLLMLSLIHI